MAQYKKVYLAVSCAEPAGSGSRLTELMEKIKERIFDQFGVKINMGITRHDMPETSAIAGQDVLCFDVDLSGGDADEICGIVRGMVGGHYTPEDEPGFCVLKVPMEDPEDGLHEDIASHADKKRISQIKKDYEDLIRFGQQARLRPVTADEARETASEFDGINLEGEGEKGLIGALAGVGLRISGENGNFLGTFDMTDFSIRSFGAVAQCIGAFRMHHGIDPNFVDRTGGTLGFHDRIRLIPNAAAILVSGRFSIMCSYGNDELWTPYTKDDFGKVRKRRSCDFFELDPDEEETFRETRRRSCGTCLFRKLTNEGFVCTAGHEPVR